jgi:hypothetical protein
MTWIDILFVKSLSVVGSNQAGIFQEAPEGLWGRLDRLAFWLV